MSLPTPYYDDGHGIVIYHGDCREILPHLPKVDLIVSDPPFGINHASGHGASWENTVIANDDSTDARDAIIAHFDGIPMFLFGTWKVPRPLNTRQVLIFDKGPAFGMGDLSFPWKNSFEEIYVIGSGFCADSRDEGVIRGHFTAFSEAQGRVHPNQKPVSLLAYLITRHPGQTILDPFMGSGTTLVAAQALGRKAIGIEISQVYCDIAIRRLQQQSLPLTEPLNGYKIEPQEELYGAPANRGNEEENFSS